MAFGVSQNGRCEAMSGNKFWPFIVRRTCRHCGRAVKMVWGRHTPIGGRGTRARLAGFCNQRCEARETVKC